MRLIYMPGLWTLLLCFPVWALLQTSSALLCLLLPDRCFSPDSFFYRAHRFENNGRLYERIFRVSRWKRFLPDGGAALDRKGYRKKKMTDFSEENLRRFRIESARGEATHWLAIFPFWVFGFFVPPQIVWLMLLYALAVNLPCIVTQRYNRPRVKHLLEQKEKRHAKIP